MGHLVIVVAFILHSSFNLHSSAQVITTVAGGGGAFRGDGKPAIDAALGEIRGVAVDSAGNVFATDPGNNLVVKIAANGILSVVAGNGLLGFSGDGGAATSAALVLRPCCGFSGGGIAVDRTGNVYFADSGNGRVRKVTPAGIISTVAGGGSGRGDGGPATSAQLYIPGGIAMGPDGSLYVGEEIGRSVRKVRPDGIISTVAAFPDRDYAEGVAVDAGGNVYVAIRRDNVVVKIDSRGNITTAAGTGSGGYSGDGGPATSARLDWPDGLALDPAGNLYIADSLNGRIRRVDTRGVITTAAEGVPQPVAVAVDSAGNLYVASHDSFPSRIGGSNLYRVLKVGPAGATSTLAGSGSFRFSGDGGPATSAALYGPAGVAVDAAGNLYIADT